MVPQSSIEHATSTHIGDDFEVIGLAPDDATERDDRVVGSSRRVASDRYLERTGHGHLADLGDPAALEGSAGTGHERRDDLIVEAGTDNADPEVRAVGDRRRCRRKVTTHCASSSGLE